MILLIKNKLQKTYLFFSICYKNLRKAFRKSVKINKLTFNEELIESGKKSEISITFTRFTIDFQKQNKIIRLSNKHLVYSWDIINSFEYYFNSVVPVDDFNDNLLVDFSNSRYHEVTGFSTLPILFPSLAEPIITTTQYLDFADLQIDSVVIDLGAYSGLTSMLFKMKVLKGEVIAVDADEINLFCMSKNFSLFRATMGLEIKILKGAIWDHDRGVYFSSEGNMGSSATSIIGERGGTKKFVESYKLIDIANKFDLKKVDFIKCDVEGAEAVIFNDDAFFEKYKPKIIVEPHFVDGQISTSKVEEALKKYGYKFDIIEQHGVALPLLHCQLS